MYFAVLALLSKHCSIRKKSKNCSVDLTPYVGVSFQSSGQPQCFFHLILTLDRQLSIFFVPFLVSILNLTVNH
jgi:hypothetical protein